MDVSTRPGWIEVTRTRPLSSSRNASVKARRANLLPEYRPLPARELCPAPELIAMTCPPASRRAGSARRVSSATAKTLISNIRCHCVGSASSISAAHATPAEWTSTSSPSASTRFHAAASCSASVRSATKGSALGRLFTASATVSGLVPPTRMWWSLPSSCAMARPIPREPPVTSAVLRLAVLFVAVLCVIHASLRRHRRHLSPGTR